MVWCVSPASPGARRTASAGGVSGTKIEVNMASAIFFIAPPLFGGFLLAPMVQTALRLVGASLMTRIACALGLVGAGAFIYRRGQLDEGRSIPFLRGNAGNGFKDSDLSAYYGSTTLVTTGCFTMLWGVVINALVAIATWFN